VSDRENRDVLPEPYEDDPVWEIVHRKTPRIRVRHAGNQGSAERIALEMLQCLRDLNCEAARNLFASLTVPRDRFSQIAFGKRAEADFQRDRTSR
jgi:hypothetical protein